MKFDKILLKKATKYGFGKTRFLISSCFDFFEVTLKETEIFMFGNYWTALAYLGFQKCLNCNDRFQRFVHQVEDFVMKTYLTNFNVKVD